MDFQLKKIDVKKYLVAGLAVLCLYSPFASADEIPAAVQARVDEAMKQIIVWAAHPDVVDAARKSNAFGGIPGMTNGKWDELSEDDPLVTSMLNNKASMLIRKWEKGSEPFNKLVLRNAESDVSAASIKPLVYHNIARPVFFNAIKGKPWRANEIKPDPTTQIKSVQISAPVMDGGKVIGVLHAGIGAD